MIEQLKDKKIRGWCSFDFGISCYPTLILTFFYGAFYAKKIAVSPEIGTSNWGFSISIASILSFLLFSIILVQGKVFFGSLKTRFFGWFFLILVLSTASFSFFDESSNEFYPLIVLMLSLICFEMINLFYNLSLHKVAPKHKEGQISNLGWAFGYFGGLCSLAIIFLLLELTKSNDFRLFGISVFLLIGPFVALWTMIFGYSHIKNFIGEKFVIPNIVDFLKVVGESKLTPFLISYFFFNNAVISIFAFASMFASFLFGFTESQILFLGVFINLFGIFGCLVLGRYEDKIGSEKTVLICISSLLLSTGFLYFTKEYEIFWILALLIGFFIGPIQAASRSVIVKKIKSSDQLSAFCSFAMFGNICAILGPFLVSLIIDYSDNIRYGLLIIPSFFLLSLVPFKKISV
jgi:UMF1 family MFS transporter